MIAAALLGLLFGGVFAITGQSVWLLQTSTRQAAATLCLQERMEAIRALKWAEVTDAAHIRDNVLDAAPGAAAPLQNRTELITVNSYPAAGVPIEVSRPAAGPATVGSSNAGLAGADMLRVDTQITWTGAGGVALTRQFTTLVTPGGTSR